MSTIIDLAGTASRLGASQNQQSPARPLSIAVVNNMPDSALRTTERQICSVLGAASSGITVDVRFYTMPVVPRSAPARAHIDACYEPLSHLMARAPDGLIVTGTEPLAMRLAEEPSWPALCDLIDWTEEEGIPSIWSCLAAHAAVLRLDGVERSRLPRKLSGLFASSAQSSKHPVMHRMPRKWVTPHSRWNGLSRNALEAQGYTILSHTAQAGVDMFMKEAPVLQIFLQGHPEYDATTLLAEYRRDVLRASAAGTHVLPDLPLNVAHKAMADQIRQAARSMVIERRADMLPKLDLLLRAAKPDPVWTPVAETLFRNWLSYLDVRCARNEAAAAVLPGQDGFAAEPALLALSA